MKLLFLLGFLNLVSSDLLAQEWSEPENELPRWRYGIDISTPLLLQLDNYANWERAFQLEGLVQYRLGRGSFWPQVYGGYFTGRNTFDRAQLNQRGFFLKPGMAFQFGRETRAKPYLELNALISWGSLGGYIEQADPVYGDTQLNVDQRFDGGGMELGVGAFVASVGKYRLRLSSAGFVGGSGGAEHLRYLPGAGRLGGYFIYFSGAVRLHLLRVQ